jgi:hypothetical protein
VRPTGLCIGERDEIGRKASITVAHGHDGIKFYVSAAVDLHQGILAIGSPPFPPGHRPKDGEENRTIAGSRLKEPAVAKR